MHISSKKSLGSLPPRADAFIEPMECMSRGFQIDGAQWLYKIKLDAEAIKSDGNLFLLLRNFRSAASRMHYFVFDLLVLIDCPRNSEEMNPAPLVKYQNAIVRNPKREHHYRRVIVAARARPMFRVCMKQFE